MFNKIELQSKVADECLKIEYKWKRFEIILLEKVSHEKFVLLKKITLKKALNNFIWKNIP